MSSGISKEDLQLIQNAKANAAYMKALADVSVAEAKVAELEMRNIILRAYMKYGLDANKGIDNDGNIVSNSPTGEEIKASDENT